MKTIITLITLFSVNLAFAGSTCKNHQNASRYADTNPKKVEIATAQQQTPAKNKSGQR